MGRENGLVAWISTNSFQRNCEKCGEPVHIETSINNTVWNLVIRKGGPEGDGEYLCASCIIGAMEDYILENHKPPVGLDK